MTNSNPTDATYLKDIKKDSPYDVTGLGSALLDFTVEADESLLEELGLTKGHMTLIDEDESRKILARLEGLSVETTPGGSSANTTAGAAIIGSKSVFLGTVGDDKHGELYKEKNEAVGVKTVLSKRPGLTGHAITFITPDSERTFATHLGAALHFGKDDLVSDDIANAKILHLEGYLLEADSQREMCLAAIDIAHKNGVKVSVDLADPSLIQRKFDDIKDVAVNYADIIFVNEEEAQAFTGVEEEEALKSLSKICELAVVKLGEKGSIIGAGGRVITVPPRKVEVINTNGAGDMYAAALLSCICRGDSLEKAGKVASYMASLVIAQVGARISEKVDIDSVEL